MDKEKVIKLAQQLAHVNYSNKSHSKEFILEDIIKELNSKPVMPKVFDTWHKEEVEIYDRIEGEVYSLIIIYDRKTPTSNVKSENELFTWLNESWATKETKFIKCIDAIRYGYEVEK